MLRIFTSTHTDIWLKPFRTDSYNGFVQPIFCSERKLGSKMQQVFFTCFSVLEREKLL